MALQINKYASQHELAFEGKYDSQTKKYSLLDAQTYMKFRKNDNISHFICRLAYCRNEDLRKWFLIQETRFFQIRIQATQAQNVLSLLREHLGIKYETLKDKDEVWIQH